jgi:O-antigen/teichoic acid export membrane protein
MVDFRDMAVHQPLGYAVSFVRKYFVRTAVFGGNFFLAKGAAFFGPLALAAVLDPTVYGNIEYAWSFGMVAATLLGAGLPASIPQLSLLRRPIPLVDVYCATLAVVSIAILVIGLAWRWLGSLQVAGLVAAAILLALTQANLSSYSRTFSYRNWAVWLDGVSIHVTVLLTLVLVAAGLATTSNVASVTTVAAMLVPVAALTTARKNWQPKIFDRLQIALQTGLPLLAYSLCAVWAAMSPRIYLGALLPAADVSMFSICFRVGSSILLLHTVLATGLFASLYRMPTRRYDQFASIYLVGIGVVCVLLVLVFPLLIQTFELRAIPPEQAPATVHLFRIVILLIFGWQVWAILEMRVARVRRASQAAWRMAGLFTVFAIVIGLLAVTGSLTVAWVAWLAALQMLGGCAIQAYVLWRRGAKMPLTIASTAAASTGLASLAYAVGS